MLNKLCCKKIVIGSIIDLSREDSVIDIITISEVEITYTIEQFEVE